VDDIAHGVLFLASDESAFITGNELTIEVARQTRKLASRSWSEQPSDPALSQCPVLLPDREAAGAGDAVEPVRSVIRMIVNNCEKEGLIFWPNRPNRID
jgi:hypothetical protein